MEECKTCTFFKGKQGPGKTGRCKRFPHSIDKTPHDWCGEYIRDPRLVKVHQPHSAGNVCVGCGSEGGLHHNTCSMVKNHG